MKSSYAWIEMHTKLRIANLGTQSKERKSQQYIWSCEKNLKIKIKCLKKPKNQKFLHAFNYLLSVPKKAKSDATRYQARLMKNHKKRKQ